jgi:HEAT repeat protein
MKKTCSTPMARPTAGARSAPRLLGELRAESAVPRLIELATNGPDCIITSEAAFALERIGEAAIEPVLQAASVTDDDFYRSLLCEVLAGSSRQDDRIFELLLRLFRQDPLIGIGALARYGDRRALPELTRLLERHEPGPEYSFDDGQLVIELREAFRLLDAELTPAQRERLERLDEERKRERALASASPITGTVRREGTKVGRNDPCPCGSGKKFKKCCGQ